MSDNLTKGEQTRQSILNAAGSLFIEQGFHGTSMRQIAARAGITAGSIYNHFESKEQIFDHILLEQHPYRRIIPILEDIPAKSVEEFTHQAVKAIIDEMGSRPDLLKLAFIELSEFKGKHIPQLFQIIFPQTLPLVERFKNMPGELRDLSAQAVLLSFAGMFFAYYLSDILTGSDEDMKHYRVNLDQYLTIFLHGIIKTEQP
jgi:AcrR family transcriptional regulator